MDEVTTVTYGREKWVSDTDLIHFAYASTLSGTAVMRLLCTGSVGLYPVATDATITCSDCRYLEAHGRGPFHREPNTRYVKHNGT